MDGSRRSRPRSRAKWLRVPAGDRQEGHSVAGGHLGDQGLRAVAPGHAQQVRPLRDRAPGQGGHVLVGPGFEQDHLGARRPGPGRQVEAVHLAAPGERVHHDPRVTGRGRRAPPLPGDVVLGDQRGVPRGVGDQPQDEGRQGRPQHAVRGVEAQDRERSRHGQQRAEEPQRSGVGERPPHADRRQRDAHHREQEPERTAQSRGDERHHGTAHQGHQCQTCPPWTAFGGHPAPRLVSPPRPGARLRPVRPGAGSQRPPGGRRPPHPARVSRSRRRPSAQFGSSGGSSGRWRDT